MTPSGRRRFLTETLTYLAIIAVTLGVVDIVCIATGLFPPTYNYGDTDLGWRPARATGREVLDKCVEYSTGDTIRYRRNEDGIRTAISRARQTPDTGEVRIAVTGDSQTDLCSTNDSTHAGQLEAALAARGVRTTVLAYGSGRYSPLQDYLAFKTVLKPYRPQVLVMNLYTGNDFYDILRVDDRPHFVSGDSGYVIAPPTWYSMDNPEAHYRSRVLYAVRTFSDRIGLQRTYFRLAELRRLTNTFGGGVGEIVAYVKDLWRAREPTLGYPDAFTAQILNQQIFFDHFPAAREESLRRIGALMRRARKENPGLLLVMSPLPSYELVGEQPVDSALIRTLRRLGSDRAEGIEQEGELYARLRELSEREGWLFVDNLAALRAYQGPARLYNDFDYHLLPVASAIVGQVEAEGLAGALTRVPAQH